MTRRSRGLLGVLLLTAMIVAAVEAATPAPSAAQQQRQEQREPERRQRQQEPDQQQGQQEQEQQQQEQQEPEQEQEEKPEPKPDLRIVRIEVAPSPLRDGSPGTVTVMLHNRSPVVITGSIVVEVTHDRGTPQPLPFHREVYYLDPDALTEVTFELPAVAIDGSPYTFFATVDRADGIDEGDEVNNANWERVAVCQAAEAEEIADGVDNDCDGMTDEGLGLSAEPGAALRLLRVLQRQAALDSVLLVYATARLFAPQPVEYGARLESEDGDFVGLRDRAGAEPSATFSIDDPNAQLELVDWNGAELENGDLISMRIRGDHLIAEGGGGGDFVTRPRFRERERLFTLGRIGVSSGGPEPDAGRSDDLIRNGDVVSFAASTGHFLSAEQGGGGRMLVDRSSAAGWESFTITLRGSEQKP